MFFKNTNDIDIIKEILKTNLNIHIDIYKNLNMIRLIIIIIVELYIIILPS